MRNYKRCPRCGEKNAKNALRCCYCNLIFERLNWATNSAGKKMLKQGKKNKVVYVTEFPSDLQRHKVLLLCLFLGLWGGHCFYVGRLYKGIYMLISGTIYLIGGVLSIMSVLPQTLGTVISIFVGILGFIWLFDIFDICVKRFKVPVYIDFTEEK